MPPPLIVYEFSFANGKLSYSQYLALIILLYKEGLREDIKNWRPIWPISLSSTDTKISTKVFAERIKIVLPEIIQCMIAYVINLIHIMKLCDYTALYSCYYPGASGATGRITGSAGADCLTY